LNHTHREFKKLTKVEDALRRFLQAVDNRQIRTEVVPIAHALGRVLSENVACKYDLPSTDRAVVDGFALRSTELLEASASNPVVLRNIGESILGEECRLVVHKSETVSVATGSTVPKGTDAVVPIEEIMRLSSDRISVSKMIVRGQNILFKGEDVARNQVVLMSGAHLRPQDLGILKALGFERIRVLRKPRVAVISTGSELVESLHRASPSQTVDTNRVILASMVQQAGGVVVDFGIVKDRKKNILFTLKRARRLTDLILVTGGSSVGSRDLIPSCINELGKPGMLVHGIAMRPAMPTGLGAVNRTPIISLPGFPVSAMFAFLVFGRPVIFKLGGNIVESKQVAKLSKTIRASKGFRTFVRVSLRKTTNGLIAIPVKSQKSSMLTSIISADGFITIREDEGQISANQSVEVTLMA
jgi:molybdenum cofactor synthesis domain-containing protein